LAIVSNCPSGHASDAPEVSQGPNAPRVEESTPPLLTIRFNKQRVDYDRQLDFLLKKALAADKNIRFNVRARLAPNSVIGEANFKAEIERLIDKLIEAGVKPSDIDVRATRSPSVEVSEIRLERNL